MVGNLERLLLLAERIRIEELLAERSLAENRVPHLLPIFLDIRAEVEWLDNLCINLRA